MKTLSEKIAADKLEEADRFARELHGAYNDQPLAHARIHFTWARIAWLRNNYLPALGHMVAGTVFAIPVSLFKKLKSS